MTNLPVYPGSLSLVGVIFNTFPVQGQVSLGVTLDHLLVHPPNADGLGDL